MRNDELQTIEKEELAKRMKYVRKELAHQTQNDFAFSLYVSRVYINQLENAKCKVMPSSAFFERICKQYHVSNDWIRYGRGQILEKDTKEELEIMQHQDKHIDIPEGKLYFPEMLQNHCFSELDLDLKELLTPDTLTSEQYARLVETYTILSRPLLQLMESLKKKETLSPELYETYYQKVAATIRVFLTGK